MSETRINNGQHVVHVVLQTGMIAALQQWSLNLLQDTIR